jgi:hypothetical protein
LRDDGFAVRQAALKALATLKVQTSAPSTAPANDVESVPATQP